MTVMSVAILATICQMPDFRVSSSLISTPQSQEVRPRKPRQAPPLRPLKASESVCLVEVSFLGGLTQFRYCVESSPYRRFSSSQFLADTGVWMKEQIMGTISISDKKHFFNMFLL